jgi:hypothetical protein
MRNFTEQFKVVAISNNTNSFGLKQMVLVAKSGTAYKACASYFNLPEKDSFVEVPINVKDGVITGYNFTLLGYEIPEKMEDCPREVLVEIFPELL